MNAIQKRLQLDELCAAAAEVFAQWWSVRRIDDIAKASAVIRRCATAYLVRQTVAGQLPHFYDAYFKMNHTDDVVVIMPAEMNWYTARLLPRYFRVCTAKLRIAYDADIRFRQTNKRYTARYKAIIDRIERLSMWAYYIHLSLLDTEDEPEEVALIRSKVRVVKAL